MLVNVCYNIKDVRAHIVQVLAGSMGVCVCVCERASVYTCVDFVPPKPKKKKKNAHSHNTIHCAHYGAVSPVVYRYDQIYLFTGDASVGWCVCVCACVNVCVCVFHYVSDDADAC